MFSKLQPLFEFRNFAPSKKTGLSLTIILQTERAAPTHHQAQPLWGTGAIGTTGMSMASKTYSSATTSRATQGASATTRWPIAAIALSSTSAELTAGAGEKTSLTTGETTTGFAGILW